LRLLQYELGVTGEEGSHMEQLPMQEVKALEVRRMLSVEVSSAVEVGSMTKYK